MRTAARLGVLLLEAAWAVLAPAPSTGLFPPEKLAILEQVVDEVFSLNHLKAAALCRDMIARWPDDPAGYAFLARTYWSEELSTRQLFTIDRFAASGFFSETSRYKVDVPAELERRFRQASDEATVKGKARLRADPSDQAARYSLVVAYQNLATFEAALKTNWWQAIRFGDQALRFDRDLISANPSCADARVTTGIYQYAVGSVPWKLRWLTFLLGYRGDKETGKRELRIAAEKGLLAPADARLVLVLFHTLDREYDAARAQLGELLRRYPRNYLMHLDMAALATRMSRPREALDLYLQILRMVDEKVNGYERLERAVVLNQLGAAARGAGDLDASVRWLRQALEEPSAAARTKTIAHLELGKTLDLLGRRQEALEQYRAVEIAEDFAGSRAEAGRRLRGRAR